MKIIAANKYYYLKGGAERYLLDTEALLSRHGHEVIPFAMQSAKNNATPWSRFFVSPVETERVSFSLNGLKTAGRFLYSFEAAKKFDELLASHCPDIIHVHNIYHQISPSILPKAKLRGVPVVMTVHDYKLIAPNYSLFHDGEICERTKPRRYWRAFLHRCIKRSYVASALEAVEMTLHRALGLYEKNIDLYIAPSRFMRAKLAEYGIDPAKIRHLPNYMDTRGWEPSYEGRYALFVGRLSAEKGVDVLIRAAAKLPELPVRIVGTGPDEKKLQALRRSLGAKNVEFVGFKAGEDLRQEYRGARFVVVPSVWYENFGLVVLEALAAGKPVIGSQLGGIPEVVEDGVTGRLVSAGDVAGLTAAMWALWSDPQLCADLGRTGRARIETDYTAEGHYKGLMTIYQEAISLSATKQN